MDNQVLETSLEELRKELCFTRIFCVISSLLTCALLVGVFFLYGQLKPALAMVEETKPVIEELAGLDIENVNLTLEQISYTLGAVDWEQVSDAVGSVDWQQASDAIGSVDWQEVSDTLGELDVDALNDAIEGLDTKEISKAIERLNAVVDVLETWGEKLGSLGGIFGK